MSKIQKYDELLLDYERVTEELNKLKKDCEENTIIQSMNDMKKMYETQEKKIEKMSNIIDKMNENTRAVQLMLKTVIKNMDNYNSRRENITRFELKTRLEFINEILSNSLKTKNELYYLSYE
jgi:putative cell wall-binding protein